MSFFIGCPLAGSDSRPPLQFLLGPLGRLGRILEGHHLTLPQSVRERRCPLRSAGRPRWGESGTASPACTKALGLPPWVKLARMGISSTSGWLSITMSTEALMPGRIRGSTLFRVAHAGNCLSASRSAPRKARAAIGLIQSTTASNSLSGMASTRTLTACPSWIFPRSTSSSFSSTRIELRSGISAMGAPVQTLSPSRNGGSDWPKLPSAPEVRQNVHYPVGRSPDRPSGSR